MRDAAIAPPPPGRGSRARAAERRAELTAYPGEVVGLAGLAGQGQTEMLVGSSMPPAAGTATVAAARHWSPATGRPRASFRSGRLRATSASARSAR